MLLFIKTKDINPKEEYVWEDKVSLKKDIDQLRSEVYQLRQDVLLLRTLLVSPVYITCNI